MVDILVVGGGGYIGSHTCLDLSNKGYRPVVYDNLSNGHPEFVKWGPLEQGDIRDRARLDEVFRKYRPELTLFSAASGCRPMLCQNHTLSHMRLADSERTGTG